MQPIGGGYGSAAPLPVGNTSLAVTPAQPGMDPRRLQMAMALMGQQLKSQGGGMAMPPRRPPPALDIYGNPVGG